MFSLLQQLSEALAGALRQAHSAAVPATDQLRHRFGRRGKVSLGGLLVQTLDGLAHEVRPGAAGLVHEALERRGRFRVDPDI
jgi:hypothetical protein